MKQIPVHLDKLGRELKIGDCVAYPSHNTLYIGTIKKLHNKMVGVEQLASKWRSESNKYPQDMVLLEGADVTMYVLKNTKIND